MSIHFGTVAKLISVATIFTFVSGCQTVPPEKVVKKVIVGTPGTSITFSTSIDHTSLRHQWSIGLSLGIYRLFNYEPPQWAVFTAPS